MTVTGAWRGTATGSTGFPVPSLAPRALLRAHRIWALAALGHLALLALLLVAALADERLFHGVSVWTKPAKFALSIAVYLGTLAWFASLVPEGFWRTLQGRLMTWTAVVTALFEMVYILVMAALGEASHFNVATPFTAIMYSLMGLGAMTLTAVSPWLAVVIARRTPAWRGDPFLWGVVVGLILTFVLGAGFGGYLASAPGHWVEAPPTDAGGVPLFGWTRSGGDLRVAHFFGLHAMQVLPLFALLVRRSALARPALSGFTVVYALLTVATFVQAVSGRPLLG